MLYHAIKPIQNQSIEDIDEDLKQLIETVPDQPIKHFNWLNEINIKDETEIQIKLLENGFYG